MWENSGNFNAKYVKNPEQEFPLCTDSLENCADHLGHIFAAQPMLLL